MFTLHSTGEVTDIIRDERKTSPQIKCDTVRHCSSSSSSGTPDSSGMLLYSCSFTIQRLWYQTTYH